MIRADSDGTNATLVPCTLYSGDYHLGVGALANSLYRNGFRGTLCVGYQPPLPPWAKEAKVFGDDMILQVCPDFFLRFIAWSSKHNLSLEKARFLLHVLDEAAPESEGALLFDADITVHGSWAFFEQWVRQGVALCLDVCYPLVPSGHPWRHGWEVLAREAGYQQIRNLDYYVNSGFVGVCRSERPTIHCWAALIETFLRSQSSLANSVKFANRERAFVGDQDMLNAALMATESRLSLIGLEGMDFSPAGYTMSHAVEGAKPWRKKFIMQAISGHPPSAADKTFWRYADHPIHIHGSLTVAMKRLTLKIAGVIGRFYRRS
jgi:hypothetical protein